MGVWGSVTMHKLSKLQSLVFIIVHCIQLCVCTCDKFPFAYWLFLYMFRTCSEHTNKIAGFGRERNSEREFKLFVLVLRL